MFTSIHLLPDRHFDKMQHYTDRWQSQEGQVIYQKVMDLLNAGAGEHFLEVPYEKGELSILEDACDLQGMEIFKFDKAFPETDNFKGIDFSFSTVYHSTFKKATFLSSTFDFTRFYNVKFIGCTFLFVNFFGSKIENSKFIDCDFIEHNYFKNSEFKASEFQGCFFPDNLFIDCKFDERTNVTEPFRKSPVGPTGSDLTLKDVDLAEVYKGLKESYKSGNVSGKATRYFVKERQSVTRYNTPCYCRRISGYFLEFVTGYGVRPLRVLSLMLMVFFACCLMFYLSLDSKNFEGAFWLSAGAFFTFGAGTDLLPTSSIGMKVAYVGESFLGISLIATLITVLANRWFSDR